MNSRSNGYCLKWESRVFTAIQTALHRLRCAVTNCSQNAVHSDSQVMRVWCVFKHARIRFGRHTNRSMGLLPTPTHGRNPLRHTNSVNTAQLTGRWLACRHRTCLGRQGGLQPTRYREQQHSLAGEEAGGSGRRTFSVRGGKGGAGKLTTKQRTIALGISFQPSA